MWEALCGERPFAGDNITQLCASVTSGKLRETLDNNLQFAIRHRDIIQQWGRFPHRNAVLGRASTPEELAFLQQPNSSF